MLFTDGIINFCKLTYKAGFLSFLKRTECLLSMIGCRSEDGDLDSSVGVANVNEKSFVVVIRHVCGYSERDSEVDWAGHADVIVVQRLRRVQRVFDHNAEHSCTSLLT